MRLARVPAILAAHRNDDLVDEWVAQARHLGPPAGGSALALVGLHRAALPARGRPHADHRLRVLDVSRHGSVPGEVGLRDLDRDRVHVVALRTVLAAGHRQGDEVKVLERAKGTEIEDRAEIHEEAFIALAGEDLHSVGQHADRGVREVRVIGGRSRADPHRWANDVASEDRPAPTVVVPLVAPHRARHRIDLTHVP